MSSGGGKRPAERLAVLLIARAVKSFLVVAVNQTEKGSRLAGPRQGGEFVHGGDEEGGQAAVDGFVNSEDWQVAVAGERRIWSCWRRRPAGRWAR